MVRAIVGANWGDEGKGKVTDMFAEQSDIVVRFQGGANAGHTIINEHCIAPYAVGCLLRPRNLHYRQWRCVGY